MAFRLSGRSGRLLADPWKLEPDGLAPQTWEEEEEEEDACLRSFCID